MALPSIPKPLILLPLLYYSRKLDAQDDDLIFKLRASFYTAHAILLSLCAYVALQAYALAKTPEGRVKVFHSATPDGLASLLANADSNNNSNNTKKKWTEVVLGAHAISTVHSLLFSTLFMIAMQTGIHFYRGTMGGLFIQSIMGPLNFIENAAVRYFLLGDKDAFATKTREELGDNDEIVDDAGTAVHGTSINATTTTTTVTTPRTLEDVLLDTWDHGAEADIQPLMAELNAQNINYQTVESQWTPVMIMAGLGVKETRSALQTMRSLGADLTLVDAEGWNALHWSAFHGSVAGAEVLLSPTGFDGVTLGLHQVRDKEGKTALEHALAEDNHDVVKVIENLTAAVDSSDKVKTEDGLRKRK